LIYLFIFLLVGWNFCGIILLIFAGHFAGIFLRGMRVECEWNFDKCGVEFLCEMWVIVMGLSDGDVGMWEWDVGMHFLEWWMWKWHFIDGVGNTFCIWRAFCGVNVLGMWVVFFCKFGTLFLKFDSEIEFWFGDEFGMCFLGHFF